MKLLIKRRALVQKLMAGISLLSIVNGAQAAPATLPVTDSLPNALAIALQAKQPLVVMVSLHVLSLLQSGARKLFASSTRRRLTNRTDRYA